MKADLAKRILWGLSVVVALLGAAGCSDDDGGAADLAGPGDAVEEGGAAPVEDLPSGDLASIDAAVGAVSSAIGCTPPTHRLVITEVMIRPSKVADLYGEWIEVYNPFGEAVDLRNWILSDASGEQHAILTSVPLAGGSYVVLCRSDNNTAGAPDYNGGVTCNYEYTSFALRNDTPDQVTLKDPQGNDVYTVSWTGQAPLGASVAIENPILDVDGASLTFGPGGTLPPEASWSLSTTAYGAGDLGTPGSRNADVWVYVQSQECSDGKVCTLDLCEAGVCTNPWKTGCCTSEAAAPNECNDGNACTAESCEVATNTCIHTEIPNCCVENADCQDDNPCNSDWCAYDLASQGYRCRHSSYNIVPGCCYAPPQTNPANGLPWDPTDQTTWVWGSGPNGVSDQREAYGAAQCDDKNVCTPNGCDVEANLCKYGPQPPTCCKDYTQCDDGDNCTWDYCDANQCNHVLKNHLCCTTNQDCVERFYENTCYDDVCVGGTCRHIFNLQNCCVDDNFCAQPGRADDDPCTDEKCVVVDTSTGERECQHVFNPTCKLGLPYRQVFDNAESLTKIGWSIYDYGSPAKSHWLLDVTGDLGPDKHVKFIWNPTTPSVQSVAHSPRVDAHTADPTAPDGDLTNTLKKTTLQWRMRYRHSPGGGPITIRAVASDDDWVTWTAIHEWTDVTDDIEYGIYSYDIPGDLWKSPALRIGFMVDTGDLTTFEMDQLEVDNVLLDSGVPNRFESAQVLRCHDDAPECEVPTQYTPVCDTQPWGTNPLPRCDVDTTHGEQLPALNMGVCEWYKVLACFRDLDATPSTWAFSGFPAGWIEGAPLDPVPFVKFKDCVADTSDFCPPGINKFVCAFEFKPGCNEAYAGTYRSGIVTQDEWKLPPGKPNSLFESLTKFSVNVLLQDGYIVWSPNGVADPSAVALRDGIAAAGRKVQVIRDILVIQDLAPYSGVFAVLGVQGRYHEVTPAEALKLANYLDNGGRVYVEGGDFWYTSPFGQAATVLHPYFKVTAKSDGDLKTAGPVTGKNFLYGTGFAVDQGALVNSWNDQIAHTPGQGGREVLRVGDDKTGYAVAVTYDSEVVPRYRTIAASLGLAALVENGGGTRNDLVARWIYFFENGYPPCTQNAQCDDFEVCTDDSCGASFVCQNAAVPNCVECMDDLYKWDGVTPSCGDDQACDVSRGYCVDIDPLVYTSRTSVTCSPKVFGMSPASRDCQMTVTTPGKVQDLQVKVKVTHAYRGDVKLALRSPSNATLNLKLADPTDARENVYATYDIGVPLPAGVSYDSLIDTMLSGVWTLTATDENPPMFNGTLDSWRIYGRYTPIGCSTADDCPDTPCTNKACIAQECKYTAFDCEDFDACTTDFCDPALNECVHKAKSSCSCDKHSDCESADDVCLVTGTDQACNGAPSCECRPICPATEPSCKPFYVSGGLPLAIPDVDDDPTHEGVTSTRTILPNEVSGVVKKLWVKVYTTHSAMGDLVAKLCHLGACVTLHANSGGNEAGFWHVYEYDLPDGPGSLADFQGMDLHGDWKLTLIDLIGGDEGALAGWTIYAAHVDCYQDSDCNDGNACTVDTCESPEDGGTCTHTTIHCAPAADSCSADQCDPADGVCRPHQQPNGTACDDGQYCTAGDSCQDGACQPGAARDCSEVGDPSACIVGVCDEDNDRCVQAPAPAGATCDDGNVCTNVDTCDDQQHCVGAADPPVCVCDPTKPPETQCQDGNLCNGTMSCDPVLKMCVVATGPKDCGEPSDVCRTMRCIPSTGECVEQNALVGTPCEDGEFCTIGDTCGPGGVCNAGSDRDCSSLTTDCAVGVCDEDLDECVAEDATDGTACEVGDGGCTVETCQGGACTFDHVVTCATQDCNDVVCQPLNWNGYQCVYGPIPDGTSCSPDTDPCTEDRCEAGVCVHPQSTSCAGAPCGGNHIYDAGDRMCGVEDSCVGGIAGYPNGVCTRTCATCAKAESGIVDLPIDERIPGGTVSAVQLSTPYAFVDEVEVKVRLEHDYIGDLAIDVIDPQGWVHTLQNYIGGARQDFSNTYDFSFPIPYAGLPESGVPMCALRGETASGTWWLRVTDSGPGNSGVLREWKLYVKGSDATNLNPGHRCQDAIDLGSIDINPALTVAGSTQCAINSASSTCGGQNGPDRLYKFTLSVPKRVTVTLRQPDRDLIVFLKKALDGVACDSATLCTAPGAVCHCSQQSGAWGPGNNGDEVIDVQLQPGVYYLGIDTNGSIYDDGVFSFDIRLKTLKADGEPCNDPVPNQDIDCLSRHCQNDYCCQAGDCCPAHEWTVPPDGSDPELIYLNPDWISANVTAGEKCPASYRSAPACTNAATCQGERFDAMCVNHMCVKTRVDDDTGCTDSVESDVCGYYVSVYCGSVGPFPPAAQTEPPCPTWCEQDGDCDPNGHCDPPGDPRTPDAPPGAHTMTCQADRPNGATCNDEDAPPLGPGGPDDSDCISSHCQNGYCCDTGDCCPEDTGLGAAECPASYEQAPDCAASSTCEGYRVDKTCINNQCGSVTVHDDCACGGQIAMACGYFKPIACPIAPSCPATDLWNSPSVPPEEYHPADPPCPTSCLVGGVEKDNMCLDVAHCDPEPGNPSNSTCQADVPNGWPCNEGTDCLNANPGELNAPNGHCQNGFCCSAGDCCSVNTDCPTQTPPSTYWAPPVCDTPSTCQGHRMDATCINYMCGTAAVDDDRACTAAHLSDECGFYLPVYCNGQQVQTDPPCPTTCLDALGEENNAACDPNAHCDPEVGRPSNSVCVADLPNDDPCDEATDCISSYCQIHFCCTEGLCCKGCRVTSFVPNLGGGGTDDLTGNPDPNARIRVQSTFGQPSPAGTSQGTSGSADFGFFPGAARQYDH